MPVPLGTQGQSRQFDRRLLEQLACPVCFGGLQIAASGTQIVCLGCRRAYPLIDGIPVLTPARAVSLDSGSDPAL
jgi:uncharacterized protein YbaR (Trm112 family)